MATPLTAAQTLAALRKWGVRFIEHPGWETHNRNGHGAWGPVNGFIVHHTGDDAPDDVDFGVVWGGRSNLPGPLCHFGARDDGTIDLVGCGRTNHAGGGDPSVLAAVIAESYGDHPPAPHYHEGSAGAVDGNARFYGVETYYSGYHVPVQYRAVVLLVAAILDAHGWGPKSAIGHKEWSDWKSDPGSVDMRDFRADVAHLHDIGPAAAAAWAYDKEDDMTPEQIEQFIERTAARAADQVWSRILPARGEGPSAAGPAAASDWVCDTRVATNNLAFALTALPDAVAARVGASVPAADLDAIKAAAREAVAEVLAATRFTPAQV